jgi:hypothetical protein
MEVIGAVSSVVALVEATGKLAKGLTHLAKRWHNAPEEINALALATQELCVKFAYVQETVTDSPATLVDDVTRHGLTQLVKKAQAVMTELSTLHNKLEAKDHILQKARWAVKDAKIAKAALDKVSDIEEGLSMWISFISLCVISPSLICFCILTTPQQGPQLDSAAISQDPTDSHGRVRRDEADVLHHDHHRPAPKTTLVFECIRVTAATIGVCSIGINNTSTQLFNHSRETHTRRLRLEGERHLAILGFTWHSNQKHERASH